jgi:hypothetical protein
VLSSVFLFFFFWMFLGCFLFLLLSTPWARRSAGSCYARKGRGDERLAVYVWRVGALDPAINIVASLCAGVRFFGLA